MERTYLYYNYFFSSNKIPVLNVLLRGTQDILGLIVIIKETPLTYNRENAMKDLGK